MYQANRMDLFWGTSYDQTARFWGYLSDFLWASSMEEPKSVSLLFFSLFSHVQLFVTPWSVARQDPLSMGFSSKNTKAGCHFLLQGIFLTQGSILCLLLWWVDSLPLSHQGNLKSIFNSFKNIQLSLLPGVSLKVRSKLLNHTYMHEVILSLPEWGYRKTDTNICLQIFGMCSQFSSVQSLSHVQPFATPWTAAGQASLSITNSWSLLKLMSIELVMPSNHLILFIPHAFSVCF